MIPDWQTNRIYFSDRLKNDYPNAFLNIVKALQTLGIEPQFLTDTKDIWVRDFMPIQITKNKYVEYRYDPDYLQGKRKGYRDLKSYPDIVCARNKLPDTIKSDLILDGGNVVKSTKSIIMTDKVSVENRLTKTETINQLQKVFEVENIILLPWYKKEKFGHSDGVVRFINDSEVILHEQDFYNTPLIQTIEKNKIGIRWLKFKGAKEKKLNWAYINFLHLQNALLIPELGIYEDDQALDQIKELYRGYVEPDRILQVKVRELVEKGGALNCISWTIKY